MCLLESCGFFRILFKNPFLPVGRNGFLNSDVRRLITSHDQAKGDTAAQLVVTFNHAKLHDSRTSNN